jgi:hypothetical protein
MQPFMYDIVIYKWLMASYFSYAAVLFTVSHVIKFLRQRT